LDDDDDRRHGSVSRSTYMPARAMHRERKRMRAADPRGISRADRSVLRDACCAACLRDLCAAVRRG
jgi:hypothetical protein